MAHANVDLGRLQETKITDGVYAQDFTGFHAVASDAPSRHHRGMALFYKESPHFSGGRCCNVVRCYLAPRNAFNLEISVAAIGHRIRGADLLFASNFNK